MSVLIRGMEMPKFCNECHFDNDYGVCGLNNDIICTYEPVTRAADCPLVPIPPHGDLIDQHRLIDVGIHLKRTVKDRSDLDAAAGVEALLYYVIEAPTVIPAEEEN